MQFSITHRELCEIIWNKKDNCNQDAVPKILLHINSKNQFSDQQNQQIAVCLRKNFYNYYNTHWRSNRIRRQQSKFEKHHHQWLEGKFIVHLNENEDTSNPVYNEDLEENLYNETTSINLMQGHEDEVLRNKSRPARKRPRDSEDENSYVQLAVSKRAALTKTCGLDLDSSQFINDFTNLMQDHVDSVFETNDFSSRKRQSDLVDDNSDVQPPPRKRASLINSSSLEDLRNLSSQRPVPFNNASRTTQFRRSNKLAQDVITPELVRALAIRKKISMDYSKINLNDMKSYSHLSGILAMYLDLDLSTKKYNNLRKHSFILFGYDVYPPYHVIPLIKKETYPSSIEVTEDGTRAEVKSVIEHTF